MLLLVGLVCRVHGQGIIYRLVMHCVWHLVSLVVHAVPMCCDVCCNVRFNNRERGANNWAELEFDLAPNTGSHSCVFLTAVPSPPTKHAPGDCLLCAPFLGAFQIAARLPTVYAVKVQ